MTTYPRAALQGLYLPRHDLTGWQVDIGSESFTKDHPGPVAEVDIELDSIGCLTSATIALKVPRHPVFPAYSLPVKFWALSKSLGLVPIALGFVGAATQDDLKSYSLPVRPLEELSLKDYFDGSLAQASGELRESGGYLQKNEEVVTAALKDRPKASIGVDHTGAVQLAEPSQGIPARVPQAAFYDWKSTGLVTLPYATRSRWDGGPGWLKGEYEGIPRPAYAERRAIDAGEVVFTEVTRDSGPPLVTQAELVVNGRGAPRAIDPLYGADISRAGEGKPWQPPPPIFTPDLRAEPAPDFTVSALEADPEPDSSGVTVGIETGKSLLKKTVTAQQYAIVHVYDLQAWYEGSSLPGQGEPDLVKQLQQAVTSAQEAFSLSVGVLGEDHDFSRQELGKLNDVKNKLRLARADNSSQHVSDYEPLTAKLSTGFVLDALFWGQPAEASESAPQPEPEPDLPQVGVMASLVAGGGSVDPGPPVNLPPLADTFTALPRAATVPPFEAGFSLLTGTSIFISMSAWDTQAVGLASDPSQVSEDPEQFSDLIHPLSSSSVIKTFDSPLVELDEFSTNTPFMQGALEIPPDYFRGPMGPALAQILDSKWLEQHDGEAPEGEDPPSLHWSGQWYFYICCWWKVVGPVLPSTGLAPVEQVPPSNGGSWGAE